MARKPTRRQFGTLRQLPSGRWQASYTAKDGQRRTAPDTFDTEAAADRWLSKVRTRRQAALTRPVKGSPREELAELADILADASARLAVPTGRV